ncbi:MAG TPA: hypothetical protein VFQ61_17190 [Polyangiaceae bacterium]|nr:hypothetical protein [Polyangiaceae bacterium]
MKGKKLHSFESTARLVRDRSRLGVPWVATTLVLFANAGCSASGSDPFGDAAGVPGFGGSSVQAGRSGSSGGVVGNVGSGGTNGGSLTGSGGSIAALGGTSASAGSGGRGAQGGIANGGSTIGGSSGVAGWFGNGGRAAGGAKSTGGASGALGGATGQSGSGAMGGSGAGGTPTSAGGGSIAMGGASTTGGASSGSQPQLPPISGTCPNFATGTTSIGGLSGISLQVGAKKEGTGSLIFYWHGTGSSASEVNIMMPAAVRQEILNQGGIIVSFQSSLRTGGDCSGTSTFSKDDFKIADLIAACAVRDHNIDPRRIYTTGCSAGGLQAGCMGALRSNYIAAVVPNSGGEVTRQPIQNPATTPAVMTMHGGSSDVVVVAFSTTSATYDSHMKSAGSFVVNCDHGGGHCGAPSALYSAGWEFMKAHPFGVEPEPYTSGLPSSFPSYCKVY